MDKQVCDGGRKKGNEEVKKFLKKNKVSSNLQNPQWVPSNQCIGGYWVILASKFDSFQYLFEFHASW